MEVEDDGEGKGGAIFFGSKRDEAKPNFLW